MKSMLPTLAEILALMELNRNSPANRRKSSIRLRFAVTRQNTLHSENIFFSTGSYSSKFTLYSVWKGSVFQEVLYEVVP